MDLNARLRNDDKNVLKELFEAHYSSVCATIQRMVGERGVTEDLAQQVFIRFWDKRHQIKIDVSPGAYLHRMAINEALAWMRAKKNQAPVEITQTTPMPLDLDGQDILIQKELVEKIHGVINELPPRCRSVFELSRFEELSYQEIASRMEISVKTVEHQIGKALRILREQLKQYLA